MLEAADELHPHLREPRRRGAVRVDMHSHTCYSGDAVTTLDELAERIESTDLDVLCVTDHHSIRGALEAVGRELDCRVVVGEEVKTRAGEVIGLFLNERVPHGLAPEETIGRIRDQGGVVYVPHPFDPVRHALREPVLRQLCADGSIDALEVFNAKVSLEHLNARAAELAAQTGLPGGAGSDAHDPAALGAAYVEMPDFDGPTDFVERLHDGRIVGHRFDRARAWTPRVIPSGLSPT
ncbi:MAG: PHP-associated domain-containing protein [Acidimicrobiia bacterium]